MKNLKSHCRRCSSRAVPRTRHPRATVPEVCWSEVKHDMCAVWEWQSRRQHYYYYYYYFNRWYVHRRSSGIRCAGASPAGAKTSFINLGSHGSGLHRSSDHSKFKNFSLLISFHPVATRLSAYFWKDDLQSETKASSHPFRLSVQPDLCVHCGAPSCVDSVCELGFMFLPSGRL